MTTIKQTKHNGEQGQAILEFAVMLPVFLLIGLGLVDIQMLVERAANLDYIANETARCMAINGPACSGAKTAKGYAESLADGLRMDTKAMTIDSGCGTEVCTASLTYPFKAIGVWFPSVVIKRTGTASLP